MSRSTEQKKKVDNFADSSFLCDSGDENNTMLKQFNKRFFDAEHPRKLESLSKYLMMKFLTVNKSAILQYELCNLEKGCINIEYSINCSNFQDGLSDGLNTGGHPLSYGGPPGGGPGGGDTRGGQCGVPGTSGPEQVPVDLSQQAHRPNGILHPDTSKFFSSVFRLEHFEF